MRLGMHTYRISWMDVTDSICRALQYSVHILQISGKSRGSTTNRIGRALRVATPPAECFNTFESHPGRTLRWLKAAILVYYRAMNDTARILEFISFCIEMYAARNSTSGQEVYGLFKRSGVLDYLRENYEPLHTQGFNYILSIVDSFIAAQGAK